MKIQPALRASTLYRTLLLVVFMASGCTFGQPTATPEPFVVTPYAAGTPATEAATTASATPVAAANATNSTATNTTTNATASESASQSAEQSAAPAVNAATGAAPLSYNGEIAADHQVIVVAETAGMILNFPLDVGAMVQQGDLVAQLDTTLLEAQKAQAMAGLAAATAQLNLVKVAPTESDLDAARAGVAAASAAYQRALNGPTAEDQRLALAQLKMAEAGVTVAQAGYNLVKGNPAIGAMPQSLQLQQATLQLEAAQAQYDKVQKGATQDVISGAYAQLANARAQLQRLEDGAKPEQVQAVEAQVQQAEMAVYLAQLQLSKATVKAPVNGIVSRVSAAVGTMAAPGVPLVTLLSRQVKVTIAVEETRLSELRIGQAASIHVDAYPERTFAGEISIIAPELDPATRTVQVTISPTDSTDAMLLAPGMFATVELY
ncbi:MAG: efflux RND transporter periplasmic adaptor subunit [Caldilineaceae bacterium]